MFTNVSSKIKTVAKVWLALGIVICVIESIIAFDIYDNSLLPTASPTAAIIIIDIIVIVIFYVSSLFLYGFGELIENTKRPF